MKCDCCKAVIEDGEQREHLGQTLCEDCYMDALSPLKTCDPWAVHSAKSFEKHMGGDSTLNAIQNEMLDILKQSGGIEPQALLEQLGGKISLEQMQREFSALRHMEKVRAEKRGNRMVWRLW